MSQPTNTEISLEGIAALLAEFCIESLTILGSKGEPRIEASFDFEWERSSDEMFLASERESWFPFDVMEQWSELESIASYAAFRDAIESNPKTAGQIDNLVGSVWGQMRMDGKSAFRSVVGPAVRAVESYNVKESVILAQAVRYIEALAESVIRQHHIVQLVGVTCEDKEVEFGDGIVLRRLRDEEISVLLRYQLIVSSSRFPAGSGLGPNVRMIPSDCQYALVATEANKKVIGDQNRGSLPMRPPVAEATEAFVAAIRLVHRAEITSGPRVSYSDEAAVVSLGVSFGPSKQVLRSDSIDVAPDAESLRDLAQDLRDTRVKTQLGIALARFRDVPLRIGDEDKLIDLMISAEALLNDSPIEVTHKMALRSAMYADLNGVPPSEVFRFLKKAYGARSKIVHGKQPGKLRRLDGSDATLANVIEDTETLVANLLLKAVRQIKATGGFHNWTDFETSYLDQTRGEEE